MGQYVSWGANAAIFVLCCFLVAGTTNSIFAALLTPSPVESAHAPPSVALAGRSWSEREVILTRNLFRSALLNPEPPEEVAEEPPEDLEATKLPLKLLGTVAAGDMELSWAAIQDREQGEAIIVRVNDEIRPFASVMRIERRRIVLLERGVPRELALEEDAADLASLKPSSRSRNSRDRDARRSPRSRRSNRADAALARLRAQQDRFEVPRSDVEEKLRNPASLFEDLDFEARNDRRGNLIGIAIKSVREGSLFDNMGLEEGDVIREVNGIRITSPGESARILSEFSQAEEFQVLVEDGAGNPRNLNYRLTRKDE